MSAPKWDSEEGSPFIENIPRKNPCGEKNTAKVALRKLPS